MEDLDDLLAPVEERFGEVKREQVANALRLGAQLAMKQDLIRKTKDQELRVELAAQITELKRELRQARNDVGIYVMSLARSLVGKTSWSMWASLGRTLAKLDAAKTNLWSELERRLAVPARVGDPMHLMIQTALAARASAASLAIEGEEE
jgi:hypothetical protein